MKEEAEEDREGQRASEKDWLIWEIGRMRWDKKVSGPYKLLLVVDCEEH